MWFDLTVAIVLFVLLIACVVAQLDWLFEKEEDE
jgi:hypothetical protein